MGTKLVPVACVCLYGRVVLGLVDLWLMVVGKLCEDLEPEGMHGLSVVVRDLVNLRLTFHLNLIVSDK